MAIKQETAERKTEVAALIPSLTIEPVVAELLPRMAANLGRTAEELHRSPDEGQRHLQLANAAYAIQQHHDSWPPIAAFSEMVEGIPTKKPAITRLL
ncbi:MAG TPA: hypothetical protein VJH24_00200 [Candidatus Bilamarchaeaceae archaeon]|nr:hypothetical protein [Candidatus Bilamarchaeaceae archaeon]